jgi:predicted glycosyltransferase
MTRPALLFYCQHSLGLGHLSRSLALCDALSERFRVVLLCGGKLPHSVTPPDGVELVARPPVGATTDGRIVSRDRRRGLDRARQLRLEIILKTFRSTKPETILIEFFPFGKKRFTDEILPLLEEARGLGAHAPLIACSIRDILVDRGTGSWCPTACRKTVLTSAAERSWSRPEAASSVLPCWALRSAPAGSSTTTSN